MAMDKTRDGSFVKESFKKNTIIRDTKPETG